MLLMEFQGRIDAQREMEKLRKGWSSSCFLCISVFEKTLSCCEKVFVFCIFQFLNVVNIVKCNTDKWSIIANVDKCLEQRAALFSGAKEPRSSSDSEGNTRLIFLFHLLLDFNRNRLRSSNYSLKHFTKNYFSNLLKNYFILKNSWFWVFYWEIFRH